jgi:hypothetical protein
VVEKDDVGIEQKELAQRAHGRGWF